MKTQYTFRYADCMTRGPEPRDNVARLLRAYRAKPDRFLIKRTKFGGWYIRLRSLQTVGAYIERMGTR